MGVPFFSAFIIPSFLFSCGLVVALYYFFATILQKKSLAIIASLIFLLNGGLGFVFFGQDILNSSQPLQTFLHPPHEYTRIDAQHIKWISVIDSMVIPQRAFNLGFPLALVALALIYQVIFLKDKDGRKLIIASAILGIMPLIHTHSFLAAGIILAFWLLASLLTSKKLSGELLRQRAYQWGMVGAISLGLAVPIYLYFFAQQTQGFLRFYPGWLAREYHINWLEFWLKNWGLTPLLGALGLGLIVFQEKSQRLSRLLRWLPYWFIFGLINLVLFQPFVWDNTKLLVWASVGIAAMAAVCLHRLYQKVQKFRPPVRILGSLIIVIIFISTIASGSIDAYWDSRTDLHSFQMYSAEELQLAEWVKKETPVDAIWLTGDQHNHWLFNLTGRQTLLTYRGWLWTHGYDYLPTEKDVRSMYQYPSQSELFKKYQIKYAVIGQNEKYVWGADPRQFTDRFPVLQQTPNFIIYSIE
jgi:hypothetical protein